MGNPTYTNQLRLEEVSLALENVLIAPFGTAWTTPGKIDVDNPPTGWAHLGAVGDDSPNLVVQKDLYTIDTGIPRVRAYQAVMGISGSFEIAFMSHLNYFAMLAAGGLNEQLSVTNAKATTAATRTVLTCNTAGFAVLDMLVSAPTTTGLNTSDNVAWVESITTTTVVVSGTGFRRTPGATDIVGKVLYSQLALGTSYLPKYALMGVADFIDGAQVVHLMRKAQPRGQFGEALRAGQDVRIPTAWDLLGYTVTTPYSSTGQVVVAERFWFPPTTIA